MVWAKLAAVATAFGQTAVRDKPASDRLTPAWASTQDHLPDGKTLDGLRCASTGLSGEQRSRRATDAVSALEGLKGSSTDLRRHPVGPTT